MDGLLHALQRELARRIGGGNRELFIWGAGGAGRAAAAALRASGVAWSGFIDRDPAKAGSEFEGLRVFPPEELGKREGRPRVLIASMYYREIGRRLRSLGFRAHRDFEIFPADGTSLSSMSATPDFYTGWRTRWLESEGCSRAGTCGTPIVHAVAAYDADALKGVRAQILRRLPAADAEWACLHSAGVRVTGWWWRKPPTTSDRVASVVIDPLPPRGRRPFLLRWLGLTAAVPLPVVCRAGVVREFFADGHAGFSPDVFAAWMPNRNYSNSAGGLCEVKLPPPPRAGRAGSLRARASASLSPVVRGYVLEIAKSGLGVFSVEEAARDLPRAVEVFNDDAGMEYLAGGHDRAKGMCLQVVAHSRGNFFFSEIRNFLAGAWRRAGAEVVTGDERSPRLGAPCRSVIVAPHEFDLLGGCDASWSTAADAILFNTEQPHTRWFAACLPRLLESRLVFDINAQTSLLLRALGVNAHFLPLGADARAAATKPRRLLPAKPAFRGMDRSDRRLPENASWSRRPIDVLFVGTLSPKRARFFAENAAAFARFRCYFHLPPSDRPLVAGSPDSLDSRDMADLCRRSKIVLNVHRDALPYCEWHRVVFHAMRQEALVVSEPMMPLPGFTAGEHFMTAPAERLAPLVTRLLTTAEGHRKAGAISRRASETLRTRFDATEIARRSLALM